MPQERQGLRVMDAARVVIQDTVAFEKSDPAFFGQGIIATMLLAHF
jgi:hypothetical protein